MKNYELTFIIDAQLAPEKQEEVITKFLDLLKSLNVEIMNVEKWGKRKLAYPIGDRQYGYYLMAQFNAAREILPQIDHHLKLSPFIFRHLLLYRDPKTLKLMKLESERLAREVMYDAEKEKVVSAEKEKAVSAEKEKAVSTEDEVEISDESEETFPADDIQDEHEEEGLEDTGSAEKE